MSHTILVADDNDDLRVLLAYQLQARGYRVLMASDGQQAVEKARGEKPDLILLDVLMPGVDGTEASARLKSDPATSKIPIIFLTSLVQGGDGTVSSAGTDAPVMGKSTELTALLDKIQQTLQKKAS